MTVRGTRNNGFTLIEVLLASALMGIVGLSIYLVFSQGLRVEARLQQGSLVGKDFFWTVYQIARDLERMQPYTLSEEDQIVFEGKRDELSFLISEGEGLETVTYQLVRPEDVQVHRVEVNRTARDLSGSLVVSQDQQDQETYRLVRTLSMFLKGSADHPEGSEETLSDKIPEGGLTFSYRGVDDEGKSEWKEAWKENYWPSIVRIDLTVLNKQHAPTRIIRDVFIGMGMAEKGAGSGE